MKNPTAPVIQPAQETPQLHTVAVLRSELLSKVGNDPEIAAELAHSLDHNHREDVDALLLAVGQEQWAEVKRYAHRILNTAQLLGCDELVGLCMRVEDVLAREADQARADLLAEYVPVVKNLSVVLERVSRTF
ncbi:Hpt domain-containing protein [Achromobacter sp.]|uniref:Hpt domain-containing protein n=1 Tax=Achromobacter sp. TaxID=134375 RepID=UPI003C7484BF